MVTEELPAFEQVIGSELWSCFQMKILPVLPRPPLLHLFLYENRNNCSKLDFPFPVICLCINSTIYHVYIRQQLILIDIVWYLRVQLFISFILKHRHTQLVLLLGTSNDFCSAPVTFCEPDYKKIIQCFQKISKRNWRTNLIHHRLELISRLKKNPFFLKHRELNQRWN